MNGNLVVALTDVAPRNLNPYKSNTLHIHTVMWPIYEPLFDIDDNGQPTARLATSWDNSADPLIYDFHLRDGVTFSDGTAFDANSVVRNLNRVKQQPTSFRERILDGLIDHVQPDGTRTVRIKIRYPRFELLFLALMTDGGEPPLGTGPFSLAATPASQIVLQKNQHYRAPVKLDQISFTVIDRPDDLVTEFNEQRLHFIRDIDGERLRQLRNAHTVDVTPFGLHYLGFNWGSTAFKRPEVRQAFRDMIDFKQIQAKTRLDPAAGPIPPSVEAYAGSTLPPQQNRDEAKSTLEGACDRPISVLYNENSYYGAELAERIESDLGSLVNLEPQNNSSELLQVIKDRGHGKPDDPYVFIYNWYSILPAAEIFLRPLFVSAMPDNLTGYSEPQVDRIFTGIQNGTISAAKGYRDAQTKIIDDMPAIYLGHSRRRHSARSANVTGLDNLNFQSFPVDRYAGVDVL